jgi:tRNA (guanine-N(7)-)-methyltransferase
MPLDCEIGCGVGWHPIQYAKANPERSLLAIEHTGAKFKRFQHRSFKHALANLRPCHANALSVIPAALWPESIDRFFILYPNPNPKAKHANLRWHNMPFMECLLTILKPGGSLQIATNERWYWEEAKKVLLETWGFKIQSQAVVNLDSHPNWNHRSHFEKKYLERGLDIYDLIVTKSP